MYICIVVIIVVCLFCLNVRMYSSNYSSMSIVYVCTEKDCYIMTDSNMDLLSIANSNLSLEYIELLLSYGFINLITKATRLASNSSTLIDHIITNKKCSNCD